MNLCMGVKLAVHLNLNGIFSVGVLVFILKCALIDRL